MNHSKLLIAYILLFNIIFSINVFGQTSTNPINLVDLTIPIYPALTLIDVSPSLIQRPASFSEFTTTVISSLKSGDGFPNNYAVDLCPFWMKKNDINTTFLNMYGLNEDNSQNIYSAIKFYSISIAFVKDPDNQTKNILSTGIHSTLIRHYNQTDLSKLKEYNDTIASITTGILLKASPTTPSSEIMAELEKNPRLSAYNDSLLAFSKIPPDIYLDFSIAYARKFGTDNFSNNQFDRFGFWLNGGASFSLSNSNENIFEASFLARYMSFDKIATLNLSDTTVTADKYCDVGLKVGLSFSKVRLNYEYLIRSKQLSIWDTNNVITNRSVASIAIRLQDDKELTFSLGKNFGDINNVISQIGFNWLFGQSNEATK